MEDERNKALYQQYLKLAKDIPELCLADGWVSIELDQTIAAADEMAKELTAEPPR